MESRRKKIFLCITKSNWGGAQKYVYDLATNLPKDQFDVSVLLGGDGELKKRLDAAGIRTILLEKSQRDVDARKEFGLFFDLLALFRKERPDIVHLNSSKLGGVGALAARCSGVKKIIFTAHGWAFNEERPAWQQLIIKCLHIVTILLCHTTIAVSEMTKDQIPKLFRKKIIVIRNGLAPIAFLEKDIARKMIAAKIGNPPSDAVWIGTVSELHTNKGLSYAIEAVSHIKQAIFVIIGDGEEKQNLEQLIEKKGLKQKVFLAGRIESAQTYLKAFDIFMLTSITEALPYAVIEAGSAGLPIVASRVGGIPEIIDDGKSGILVESRNSKQIQASLEKIIADGNLGTRLGVALKEKVLKTFSVQTMVAETRKLY
jgi:glycosyltransferase involved in cell wall biosynthesis